MFIRLEESNHHAMSLSSLSSCTMVSSELSSACSSIDIWLDSQPTVPENYEPLTPSTSPLYTCKRPAHVCTSNQQPPPSKRVRLAEIAANNVDMAGNRRSARTPSPRKRLQDVHVQAPTTQAHVNLHPRPTKSDLHILTQSDAGPRPRWLARPFI